MARIITARAPALAAASVALVGAWSLSIAQPGASADQAQGVAPAASEPGKAATAAAVAKAREQAKLMHAIYASTLEVMHQHYFRRDRAVLPARALEDVFADLERQTKIKAKWISVNAKTMNIDHAPTSAFEKNAARAIKAGKGEYELVDGGVLLPRRGHSAGERVHQLPYRVLRQGSANAALRRARDQCALRGEAAAIDRVEYVAR
jgi:hypothetical protein